MSRNFAEDHAFGEMAQQVLDGEVRFLNVLSVRSGNADRHINQVPQASRLSRQRDRSQGLAPRYLRGGPELSCSTECDRPSVCASVCSQSRADCPTGDGLDDRAGACDRAAAQAARGMGLRVPSWPMVRCD